MNRADSSPLGRGGLADDVCRRIADEIVLGQLTPGSRLDEISLATRFKVSRTPVREALKQLAIIRLVDTRRNRGSVVAALTVDQLNHMFEAIGELEATCARHAALRMNADDRARMLEHHAEGRAAMQAADVNRYEAANLALHSVIIQGSYNPVLIDMTTSLRDRVSSFRRTQFRNLERMGESFEEHSIIVEAILAHDVITTYREMRSHLLSARTATTRVAPAWGSPSDIPNP
ncbi:MAG: GntR family transcriptional regulator [Candidatus Dactylopiibacterium carminicum]|uniref:GntR family transcriptional regulator n=1 Tax=Candidatus Dactylopiibacterium carminicum TaxID=857335 RepID=A0A272ESL7_9RHOO|nr:GntR family transcriptional regulator [Candidatus Dactylopiibacterium carminicum]KAF7599031.1 GntR family transcriptional regulator [Candidatus Dactylopiibacterium carminicum]PAS93036.1 MAG: GntR family transcriptional regulator [Candidatus Dactylopiibacterium carminicum]PAS99045.1 MAG: GntR family transcriptional regulator [Candidatus Dactylopiibacterium carminicum]